MGNGYHQQLLSVSKPSTDNKQDGAWREHSLALPCEEGLLVISGEQEAQPRVLSGLQDAPEQVAGQASAPQRDGPCQEEALGGLEQPQVVNAAAGCMCRPCAGYKGSGPLQARSDNIIPETAAAGSHSSAV